MKKIIISFFLLAIVKSGFSQFEQGNILLSGQSSFGFSSEKTKFDGNDVSKQTTFSLTPAVGYFFVDNLAAGLLLDVSSSKAESETSDAESKNSTFSVGPFVRYYLQQKIFFQADLGFGSSKSEFSSGGSTSDSDYSVFSFGLGAGYAAMISDRVAIEPMLRWGSLSEKADGADEPLITSGISIGVGVAVYLGGD
jgi:outer membrane autotransporter protein